MTDILLQGGMAFGVLGGIMWALDHPAILPECPDRPEAPEAVIGRCMSDGIVAGAKPYLIGGIAGALIGLVVVLAGILLFRYLRAAHRRLHPNPAFAPPAPPVTATGSGRWMNARYPGRCTSCGGDITPGERIRHRPGHTVCARCG